MMIKPSAKAKAKQAATNPKTVAWSIAWLSLPVTFGVLEGRAMFTHEYQDTLSSNLRRLFRTNTKTGRTVWLGVIGLFGAMLAGHIMGSDQTLWE